MFTPYPNKIVIEPTEVKGPFPTGEKRFEEMGTVIAVGSMVTFVKPGDTVFFRQFGYAKTPEVDGKRYYVVTDGPEFILGKYAAGE